VVNLGFDHSYEQMPERFFSRLAPTSVSDPRLLLWNDPLARELGLGDAVGDETELALLFSGNRLSMDAKPIAMVYAGHQFGQFVPCLGDGRAILLGELIDQNGRRRDLQLKGSGRTPYSRRGDGRAWLGPVLREYLISEAMHALGIPTTRALAVVTTGEPVFREEGAMPGAILTRVASSHIRIGTFEYFARTQDLDGLRRLADHVLMRHYPDLLEADEPYLALLQAITANQARLIAQWLGVGFIHGVMNTDNMAISGETIDYGPCAFMDEYHPSTVFSFIDQGGRYAFGNQPRIAAWNLARLAEALLPMMDDDPRRSLVKGQEVIAGFQQLFEDAWLSRMTAKLGLASVREGDAGLIGELLNIMEVGRADYTLTFRGLADLATDANAAVLVARRFTKPAPFLAWVERWRTRLMVEGRSGAEVYQGMRRVNPALIPRNHRVEEALVAAVQEGDLAPFLRLHRRLADPFSDHPESTALANLPAMHERIEHTFCGT